MEKKRVLIAAAKFTYNDFWEIIKDVDNVEVVGVFVRAKKHYPDWHPQKTGLTTWTYEQLADVNLNMERTPYHDQYEKILETLLLDSRTFYFIERLFGGAAFSKSVFNNMVKVEKIVWNGLSMLHQMKPDRFVIPNTPHDILWFISKVMESVGIDVYMTATSPLPWKTWVVKGMDSQQLVKIDHHKNFNHDNSQSSILKYIKKVRSSYKKAIPEYERKRMQKYKGGFFSLKIEILSILSSKNFGQLFTNLNITINKKKSLDVYSTYSNKFIYPDKYIVFFMHYQPERTTLPEGYGYAQQWLAIRSLTEALPKDIRLVIKEHPSTFRNKFGQKVRNVEFYDAINSLPNVDLAPLEIASFDLIDRSIAVATITGTVGMEALIRGKPVIVFGAAQYRNAKGVFPVKSIPHIIEVIQKINVNVMPSDEELVKYFTWVDMNSFRKDIRINSSVEAFKNALFLEN